MKKQIVAIFLTLVMIGTIFVIAPRDLQVEASGDGGGNGIGLNYSYIKEKTESLSLIIDNIQDHGLDKGRAFGTEGEHAAAEDIEEWMEDLGLYNVHPDKLEDKWFLGKALFDYGKITEKHEILARKCTFNNTVDSNLTREVDCYIKPIENYDKTYCNTLYKGLRIKPKNYSNHSGFVEYVIDYVEDDFDIYGSQSLVDFLKSHFEDYYGFEFDEIDPDNQSTYPSFVDKYSNVTNKFVTLEENKGFNPDYMDPDENILKLHPLYPLYCKVREGVDYLDGFTYECCYRNVTQDKTYIVGSIKYDYTNESHDNIVGISPENPVIFINGSDGSILNSNLSDYRIDFHINQTYNQSVESYNVIGVINGTNNDKTVIISSLYDSVWSQGTADSAIGMSIVLAIAKYFKDYNITPKCKIKFIAFGGEEYGYRGAYYYRATHRSENIDAVIDLNQLGFSQSDPGDPECIQHVITNNYDTSNSLNDIISGTDFKTRTGTDIDTLWFITGSLSNDFVFATRPLKKPKTVLFLKDFGWYRHHRDGQGHNEGDSISYYDDDEVKVIAELVWNVTKYLAVNPDCSFVTGYPTYQTYDGDDENDNPDKVNISFSINSTMPHDKIRVFASLKPINTTDDNKDSDGSHNFFNDPEQPTINPSSPGGVLSSTSYSYNYVPAPKQTTPCAGDQTVKQRTNNSSNIITNRTNDVSDLIASDESQYIKEHLYLPYSLDGDENYIKRDNWEHKYYIINQSGVTDSFNLTIPNYMPNATYEIKVLVYNSTGIIDGEPDLVWSDKTDFSPNNDDPSNVDQLIVESDPVPLILNNGIVVQSGRVNLILNASDPNSDDIEVQVAFMNADGSVEYTSWTKSFTQGVNNTKQFTWTHPNATNVSVRTRDIKRSPNQMSNWSSPVNLSLNSSCHAVISPVVEVLDENLTFEGLQYSIQNVTAWEWDFDDGETNSSQNTSYSFNQTGSYQIALNVTDNESNVYTCNTTVTILYIKSDFNLSKDSARINETIVFTNISESYYGNITNLTWNFGDGTIVYGNNTPDHNYTTEGVYNVTLTTVDNQSNSHNHTEVVYVDSTSPDILMEPAPTGLIGLGIPVTIYGNFYDNISGVKTAKINITYPDETNGNITMTINSSTPFDYECVFNDTWKIGQYFYRLWVVDNANNTNYSTYRSFTISNLFGVVTRGDKNQDIEDRLTGSVFTMYEKGVADNITAYLQNNQTPSPKVKCHIYRANDSTLVGSTENKTVSTDDNPEKIVFNFTGTKPTLQNNTQYIVVCWSNTSCNLSYFNVTGNVSRYKTQTYGTPPQSVSFTNESRYYSLYLQYSTKPYIDDLSITSNTIGYGGNVTISANVSHNTSGVLLTLAEVEFPDNTTLCYVMNNSENDTYQITFGDTWKVGQYNYTIWAYDRLARTNYTATNNFSVSANATISICTIEDSYGSNETINITDPPVTSNGGEIEDGWSVVERGDTWDTYHDPVMDEYHTTCYTNLINYQNETGVYLPINTTVNMKTAILNDEQFEYGVTKGAYQAFWKQNTNDQKDESLIMLKDKWMLTQKPDPELAISYNMTQSVHTIGVKTTSQAMVNGNMLSYTDQYQCQGTTTGFADLQYEYQPSLLKANLVLTNPSFLSNRFQMMKQFFDENNLWLGYNTTLYASQQYNISATMGIMVDDTVFRGFGKTTTGEIWTGEQVWFTDDNLNPVFGIPRLYARDSQENTTILMKHLTIDENGEIQVSIYTSMNWLTDPERDFPVYIDPSVSMYSETGDGWALQDGSTNWDTVHDGSGSNSRDWDTSNYGVMASCGVTGNYAIRRGFFRFNTTDAVPDETVITGASLNIRGAMDLPPPYPTPIASGVVFQKWTGGGTVNNGDYNDFTGSYYGSKASWSTFSYNSIPWTYSRDEINFDGWTDVCLREWAHDYNDSSPGGETSYADKMVFADSGINKPYLSISYQYPPAITGVTPANNTINVSIAPILSITVNHTNGDNMTITWSNKINSTWHEFASNTTNGNETCYQTYGNATENGQWWEWKVNVTNGTAYREKEYRLYAGVQSKINNSGSTDISGYLLVNVSYYNETSEEWKYDMDVLWTYVTINASEELGLDTLFNDILNTDDLSFGNGTYRIAVALIDPYGDVLVCDDDTELIATYEFEVEY